MNDKILMRLHVLRNEIMPNLNALFREKVQLEEKTQKNEGDIQYARGYLEALNKVSTEIEEISKEDAISEMEITFDNDGQKEKTAHEVTK